MGTLSIKGIVVLGILGFKMWVTSLEKIGTEFVYPIGSMIRWYISNRVWNVV